MRRSRRLHPVPRPAKPGRIVSPYTGNERISRATRSVGEDRCRPGATARRIYGNTFALGTPVRYRIVIKRFSPNVPGLPGTAPKP